jgi:hypothetical protein
VHQLNHTIMADGSRCFLTLRSNTGWKAIRAHAASLNGGNVKGFLTDGVTEAWLDFEYGGFTFNVNDAPGDYWFFVNDPACPESVLQLVADQFASLLEPDSSKLGSPSNTSLERTRDR